MKVKEAIFVLFFRQTLVVCHLCSKSKNGIKLLLSHNCLIPPHLSDSAVTKRLLHRGRHTFPKNDLQGFRSVD